MERRPASRLMSMGAALALIGGLEARGPDMPRRGRPKPRKRYVKHATEAAAPTADDRQRIRAAEEKRARQAERQAKGMG